MMIFSGFNAKNLSINFFLCSLILLSGNFTLKAQGQKTICATDIIWEKHVKENPELLKAEVIANEAALYRAPLNKNGDTAIKIIPVVFHILHNYGPENISKQLIEGQMEFLNETFRLRNASLQTVNPIFNDLKADARIEFRLAKKDPNGNCTDGIIRIHSDKTYNAQDHIKSISRWDNKKYQNVWVVNSINSDGLPTGSIIAGYAQFPWDANGRANTDGIVMNYNFVKGNNTTLTHEVGHWLGLYHTFQGGCGGSNCTTSGDRVCDTPPTLRATYGCPRGQNSCSNDNPNLPDQIENFMDYTDCTAMFTLGQKERMDNMIANYRAELISANNLQATGVDGSSNSAYCKPTADFYTIDNTLVVCEGDHVQFFDNSFNSKVTNHEWTFNGGFPQQESVQNPEIRYNKSGTYTATLKVSNPAGTDVTTKQVTVVVLPAISDIKMPLIEDFDALNMQQAKWEVNSGGRGTEWKTTNTAGYSGSTSLLLENFSAAPDMEYTFTLPQIDLSTSDEFKLRFKVAYAQVNAQSNELFRIYGSTDCGKNYLRVFSKGGRFLTTTSNYVTDNFVPTKEQWREEEIDLTAFKNATNLSLKFELLSKGGNNIYIDDLNIGGSTVSIRELANVNAPSLEIFPNPAAESFTLQIESPVSERGYLEIFDMAGKLLFVMPELKINSGSQQILLNRRDLNITNVGMYYLKLSTGNSSQMRKVVFSH